MPHNVYKIDQNTHQGYQVRVGYGGEEYTKFFSVAKYGSWETAHRRAQEHRNKLLNWRRDQPPHKRQQHCYYPQARNKSTGVVGVYLTWKKHGGGGRTPYYTTTSRVEGYPSTRAFSVYKHGMLTAFTMACQVRWGCLKELYPNKFQEKTFLKSITRHIEDIFLRGEETILKELKPDKNGSQE